MFWSLFVSSNRHRCLRAVVEGIGAEASKAEGSDGAPALPAANILAEDGLLPFNPGCAVETLDLAAQLGIPFDSVQASCPRDVLMWAARHGIRPAVYQRPYKELAQGPMALISVMVHRTSDEFERGMLFVSQTLDADLVDAFLSAGAPLCVDVEAAKAAAAQDVLDVYAAHGIPLVAERILDGSTFVAEDGAIRIPEGVKVVGCAAFQGVGAGRPAPIDELLLPPGVERVEPYAFDGVPIRRIVLPPSVRHSSVSACSGADLITVYDSIDPQPGGSDTRSSALHDSPYYEDEERERSLIGWMGVHVEPYHALSLDNARPRDFTVEVRSAASGEVLYRVFLPVASSKDEMGRLFLSGWDWNARFRFKDLDKHFDDLPNRTVKMRTALNRLHWPVELSRKAKASYLAFVQKTRSLALRLCCDDGDLDMLRHVAELAECDARSLRGTVNYAAKVGCSDAIMAFLSGRSR